MSPRALSSLAFAALAAFVALTWAGILADPPLLRGAAAAALVIGVALSAAAFADARRLGRAARPLFVGAAIVAATTAALVVVGLPARLLLPGGWSELGAGVELGFSGIGEGVDYPYAGPNEWSRLILLFAAPLLIGLAAAFTLLPSGTERAPRFGGLAVLLGGYAVAATSYDPDLPLLRGVVLCLLVIAWLWLPATPRGQRLVAGAMVALALVLALPITARYAAGEGLVDYRSWQWGAGVGSSFDWEHGYGPIDWERKGETVFVVRSDRPNYWKASVLDRFNGTNWVRSELGRLPSELPASIEPGASAELRSEWQTRVQVTIDRLRSDLVVGPGTARSVLSGIEADRSADETELRAAEALRAGDSYQVRGYAPDPSVAEMRAAGGDYGFELQHYTEIDLPGPSGGASARVSTLAVDPGAATEARTAIAASPYGRMLELADRLGGDAPSAYDAVKAIETHLHSNYEYSETPPDRAHPLASFLFEDRIGYCQQFSGSMALMVRMLGIPARVATGFSPGVADGGERYTVRDLDAHSWVEVYFDGIGWVPFDPTPPDSPAELQGGGELTATAAASGLGGLLALGGSIAGAGDPRGEDSDAGAPAPKRRQPAAATEGAPPTVPLALLAAAVIAASSLAIPAVARRRRAAGRSEAELSEARVAELRAALERLDWGVDPKTTLLALEGRLRSRSEPAAAAYVGRLRNARFGPGRTSAPSGRERRALRRRLSEGRGLRGRLWGLWLIPLGAPRLGRREAAQPEES